MDALHWSVDHRGHHSVLNYEQRLRHYVSQWQTLIDDTDGFKGERLTFSVLPNYWNGYSSHASKERHFGTVTIARRRAGIQCEVKVEYHSQDAWEITTCHYTAAEGIEGCFSGNAYCGHPKGAFAWAWSGSVQGGHIALEGPRGMRLAREDTPYGVYSNWCLMHRLPQGVFCLLDGLEQVAPQCEMLPLDTWEMEGTRLMGYVLAGRGMPMSFWWADERRRPMIVSHTLQTFVLTKREGLL